MKSIHASGFHGSPDEEFRAQVTAWIAQHAPMFVSHTEATKHRDALSLIGGFTNIQPGKGECALQVRDGIPATGRAEPLSSLPIPRRNGALCEILVVKVAASEHGPAHTRIILHLPSGIEGVTGLRSNEQARVWRDCIAGLVELVASIDGPLAITGDWNVNIRRRWVRRYLRAQFPGFTLPKVPRLGATHGTRWIDFSITRGLVPTVAAKSVRNTASDHRAVIEEHVMPEPAPSDVLQVGTDSSGRGIFMTRYMDAWWTRVCAVLDFEPVVTQGAWMIRNGGGASASAGFHDGGGCLDLRVWNLTAEQVADVIRVTRERGAAAWLRDEERGGMEPHIHLVLGSDFGIAAGARAQWADYLAGLDGLASRGGDYHPRPDPIVTTPPREDWFDMATKDELREVVREEIAAMFRDEDSIGRARVTDEKTGKTWTLGQLLWSIKNKVGA